MKSKLLLTHIDGLKLYYRHDDRFIGQRVALGKYESYETKVLLRQLNSEDVAVDVGANIGYYTILMAQRCKRVYALEPDRLNFEILQKNIEANNFRNVVAVNAAAGEKMEKMELVKDETNFGNHRLTKEVNIKVKNTEKVKVVRLEDILKNEQKISLIKCDTQGWEPAVIKGAIKIIGRDYPALFLEYWPDGARTAKQDLEEMIKTLRKMYGKNVWKINDNLNIYASIGNTIKISSETGYADLWMKKRLNWVDHIHKYSDIRFKKLIKMILNVK